jgi:O-methyltransferase
MFQNGLRQRAMHRIGYALGRRSQLGRRLVWRAGRWTTLQRLLLGGPNIMRPWEDDKAFKDAAADSLRLSLCSPQSLYNLYQSVLNVRGLVGDVAEVGVYTGGSAVLLSRILAGTGKTLVLFDTFEGLPDSTDRQADPSWRPGDLDASLEAVQHHLAPWKENVAFAVGVFPDTTQRIEERKFALVHVDVDIRQSVWDCCEYFYPRMIPGGIMVFDDYGFRSCVGARQAVDEFFATRPESPLYVETGQALIWRRPN